MRGKYQVLCSFEYLFVQSNWRRIVVSNLYTALIPVLGGSSCRACVLLCNFLAKSSRQPVGKRHESKFRMASKLRELTVDINVCIVEFLKWHLFEIGASRSTYASMTRRRLNRQQTWTNSNIP
jgi:hypothetical protein